MGAKDAEKDLTVLGKPGLFMNAPRFTMAIFPVASDARAAEVSLLLSQKRAHRRVPSRLKV